MRRPFARALRDLGVGVGALLLVAGAGPGERAAMLAVVPALALLASMPLALYVASSTPTLVERASERRRRLPLWSFLLGLLDAVAVVAVTSVLGTFPIGQVLGVLLFAIALAVAVVGLVGTARGLGERLLALGARPASPLKQLGWGWLLLAGISLAPVIGALVLLYLLLGALGAGHLAFHGRRRVMPAPPPVPAETPPGEPS